MNFSVAGKGREIVPRMAAQKLSHRDTARFRIRPERMLTTLQHLMKPRRISPLTSLLAGCVLASIQFAAADELQPRFTKPVRQLLDEAFSSPTLAKPWEPGGRPGSFSITEGALKGVSAPDDSHGPSIGVPLDGRNFTIGFRFKYAKPGYFLFLLDGESRFGGAAHLLRVSLAPGQTLIQQDRGEPASHIAQGKEKREADKAGRKVPPPTKEQLADPKFYRVEKLASQPAKTGDGQWHRVLIEQHGNDVLVQVDDQPSLSATGTVIDAKKSRIVFLVGQSGTVLVDDVKVWENARASKAGPAAAKQ